MAATQQQPGGYWQPPQLRPPVKVMELLHGLKVLAGLKSPGIVQAGDVSTLGQRCMDHIFHKGCDPLQTVRTWRQLKGGQLVAYTYKAKNVLSQGVAKVSTPWQPRYS